MRRVINAQPSMFNSRDNDRRASSIETSQLIVLRLVEPKEDLGALDQNRPPDQVRVGHHQIDGFLFRLRQRPLLEYRAARADEIEEPFGIDVLLEKLARWRFH